MKITRKKLRALIVEVLDLNAMEKLVPLLLSGKNEQIAQAIEIGKMYDQDNIAKDYITSSLEKGPRRYLVDEFNTAFNLNSFSETDEDDFLQMAALVASDENENTSTLEDYYVNTEKEQELQNAKTLLRHVIDKDRINKDR